MSNKKLLTESEIRRFMKLANIPAIGETLKENVGGYAPPHDGDREGALPPPQEEAVMEAGDEMPELEAGEEEAPAGGGELEGFVHAVLSAIAEKAKEMGVEVDVEGGEGAAAGGEEMPDLDMGGEEAGEEAEEEAGEEEEEGDEEEMDEAMKEYGEEEMQEAKKEESEEEMDEAKKEEDEGKKLKESDELVEAVLARVTARLIAEAKKKKEAAKKKMSAAEKMKAMKKKKKEEEGKKLKEANAPAPKATTSSKEAPKGHGPGKKAFGTEEKTSMEWKEGKGGKGHEMKPLAASGEHTVSHTKSSKVTGQGGNKK